MTTPWYEIAKRDLGVQEIPGPKSHPRILELAKRAGIPWYRDDDTAWCAVSANGWVAEAGFTPTGSAMAREFERSPHFRRVEKPYVGCLTTFWRGSPKTGFGHVGLFLEETQTHIKLLGGNQTSPGAVTESWYPKSRFTGYWEPKAYKHGKFQLPRFKKTARPKKLTDVDFVLAAQKVGCEPAMIASTWEMEAGGDPFYPDGRVKILFEKHVFHRHLPKSKRAKAIKAGLATVKWTKYYNDQKTADQRYNMLERAKKIDRDAAYMSISVGGCQMMGFNHKICGYPSAEALFDKFQQSERAHLDALLSFIDASGATKHLKSKDFISLARIYNGTGQVSMYANKWKGVYERLAKKRWPDPNAKPIEKRPEVVGPSTVGVGVAAWQFWQEPWFPYAVVGLLFLTAVALYLWKRKTK